MQLPEKFIFAHLATPEQCFGVSVVNLQGLFPIHQSSVRMFQLQVGNWQIQEHQQLGSINLTLLCHTGRAATKDWVCLRRQGKGRVHSKSTMESDKSIPISQLHLCLYLSWLVKKIKTLNILRSITCMISQLRHKTPKNLLRNWRAAEKYTCYPDYK